MATAALGAAVLGDAVSKLADAIIHVTSKTWQFKSKLIQIQETITRNKSIFDQIDKLVEELDGPVQEKEMFIEQLTGAETVVLKCEYIKWNCYKRCTHAKKVDALNSSLLRFCQYDLQLLNTSDILELPEDTRVILDLQVAEKRRSEKYQSWRSSGFPLPKGVVIGFDDRVRDLKAMVLKDSAGDECSIVVVSAAGGCGKTTLVTMLCHDPEIQGKFGRNIYFATVTENPNLKIVINNVLQTNRNRDFFSDKDAVNQWAIFLRENKSETLLVLDDVWSDSIIKLFEFESPGYKILATSRFTYKQYNTYQLQLLNHQDATTLFRHSAFSENGVEDTDIPDDLVDKVVKCCKQHPLALEVIGGLVKGTDKASWFDMLEKLSDGQQSVLDLDKSVPLCLERSLDVFEEESVIKQSYLDLGLFPEYQKIAASMLVDIWVHLYGHDEKGLNTRDHLTSMLVDIWVHLYGHDEKGLNTRDHLTKLLYKNLATLFPIRKHSPVIDNYCEDKSIMLHDIMRTLTISLSSQEPIEERKRLIINVHGEDLPQLPETVNAHLLSISTGARFSLEWNYIEAPKVEILVLNFMSKIYPLPQFMQTMERLNVLIITNYGYHFSQLQNFPAPQYLSGLTTIRFEHVSISSICTSILELTHLKKLSLIMCNISNIYTECIPNMLPNLLEIEIDSCDDLIKFPSIFCNLISLKKLSITNCLELSSISEEFGKLTNLEVLRLKSCSKLAALPESVRSHKKLSVIDISDCLNLHKLPAGICELGSLKKIHMRGCTELHELPLSIKNIFPLEVFCDEEIRQRLWIDFSSDDVKVRLVEEDRFSLFSKITKSYL